MTQEHCFARQSSISPFETEKFQQGAVGSWPTNRRALASVDAIGIFVLRQYHLDTHPAVEERHPHFASVGADSSGTGRTEFELQLTAQNVGGGKKIGCQRV